MPTSNVRAHLAALYAGSDDPWNTHASVYERQKFAQTMASLPRRRYRRCLEVGCGAGALTALLAQRCDDLVAMDCTARALAVAKARASRPNVVFIEGAVPGNWPTQPPDLVVLSEVVYFMTDDESAGLAVRLAQDCAQECDVVLVNWLGDTGGAIGGAAAALRLIGMLAETHHRLVSCVFDRCRIDVLRRTRHAATSRAGHRRPSRRLACASFQDDDTRGVEAFLFWYQHYGRQTVPQEDVTEFECSRARNDRFSWPVRGSKAHGMRCSKQA